MSPVPVGVFSPLVVTDIAIRGTVNCKHTERHAIVRAALVGKLLERELLGITPQSTGVGESLGIQHAHVQVVP